MHPSTLARAVALLALAASACTEPVEKPDPVAIASFEVAPARLAKGGSVTLTWSITGDIGEIQILRGEDVIEQPTQAEGSFDVTGLTVGRQSFRLLVRGRGGDEVSRDGSADVFDVPTIAAFGADRTEVRVGTAVVLSWRTATADSVTVTGSDGSSVAQVTGEAAAEGSASVTPNATTTYTLTAVGVGGSSQATVVVNVLPLPSIATLEASPARVLAGQPVTLTWTTSNATGLSLRVGERTVFNASASAVASGSRTVIPTENTTYTAVATGPGGSANRDVAVEVIPLPRVARFVAEPAEVIEGGSSMLRWEFVGVETVSLTADGEPVELADDGPSGSLEVTPSATTLYEVTGTGEGGSVSASLAVTVISVPTITRFESDKTFVYRNRESATLTWEARHATVASIADSEGNLVDLGDRDPNGGTVDVMPGVTTNYTLTIAGPGGTASAQLIQQITVDDPAPNVTFSAAAAQVILGTTTELSWRVVDATSMTITQYVGGSSTGTALDLTGKSFDDVLTLPNPTDDTTYTLNAVGVRPDLVASASVSIRVVRLPSFVEFTSDRLRPAPGGGEEVLVTAGRNHTVSWETIDATEVRFDPAMLASSSGTYTHVRGSPDAVPILTSTYDDSKVAVPFPDGFRYPWFGTTYDSFMFSTNGWICFGTGCDGTSTIFSSFGTGTPNNLIAAFADDLLAVASEAPFNYRIEGTAPNRVFSVEWGQVGFYANTSGGKLSAKIMLYEDGRWEIWNDTRPPLASGATSAEIERYGTFARIGFEGPGGVPQMVYSNNSSVGLCGRALTTADPSCPNQVNVVKPLTLSASGSAELRGEANACLKMIATGPVGSTTSPCLVVRTVPETTVGYFGGVRVPSNSARAAEIHSGASESIRLDYEIGPATPAGAVASYGILNERTGALEVGTNTLVGQIVVAPPETTTYTVFAENEAGDRQEREVTVRVAPPEGTLAVSPASGQVNDPFTFTWTSSGARTLRIVSPSGAVVGRAYSWDQTSDQSPMISGSATANLSEGGTYTLELVNASGTTTATATVDVVTELRVVSFTADKTEATAESNVTLSWETLNATGLVVEKVGTAAPIATIDAAGARRGNVSGAMDGTTTTFTITATGAGGATLSRTVSVASVPKATIPTFVASSPVIPFGGQTTLTWTTENATKVNLFILGTAPIAVPPAVQQPAPVIGEILEARDVQSGSVVVAPVRSTGYRLVVENRLGSVTQRELDPRVTVNQQPPVVTQFDVTPGDFIPNGGQATLTWNTSQAENTYLWMRHFVPTCTPVPPATTCTPAAPLYDVATEAQDPVNVPYDYRPYDFEDISATGAPLAMGFGTAVASLSEDIDDGYTIVDFPSDFRPHFFGEDMARMMVSTDGAIHLAPPGAADTFFDGGGGSYGTSTTSCRTTTSTAGCGVTSPSSVAVSGTTTVPSNRIFPFFSDLSGCNNVTTAAACAAARGGAGRIYWQLVGTAPNRRLIVQWDRWDAMSTLYVGEYTFQAKLHESGDVEFQYKKMQPGTGSSSAGFARSDFASVGVDKRGYKGAGVNYFLAITLNDPIINPGDGWIIYSGRRPSSGTLKSFVKTTRSVTITDPPPSRTEVRLPFRIVATNSRETDNRSSIRREPLQGLGQNDLFISEIMIDPDGEDLNREWIEVRNIRSAQAQLSNFTLQTSSGSYLIPGGAVPGTGYLVLGQSNVTAENGGVPVGVAYGNGLQLDDGADSVILRVGNALIDRVEYDVSAGWRVPRGRSIAFGGALANHVDNDTPADWCAGRDPANANATSTPGLVNAPCEAFEVIPYNPIANIRNDADAAVALSTTSTDDDRFASITLPAPIQFYGITSTTLNVNDNGWLSFLPNRSTTTYSNLNLPTTTYGSPAAVYAYWDDLYLTTGANVWVKAVGTAPNRTLVVQWYGHKIGSSGTQTMDFSVLISEATGTAEIHYTNMAAVTGSSATVGMEFVDPTSGKVKTPVFSYNSTANFAPIANSFPAGGTATPVGIRFRKFE